MSAISTHLVRRPARVVPTIVLALVAVAAGGLGTWLLGAYALEGAWPGAAAEAIDAIGSARLDATGVLVAAAIIAGLGLSLVVCALVPGDAGHRAILADDVPGQTAVSRRDLGRRVQRRVELVDGVHDVRVTVRRRRVDVLVRTPVDDTDTVLRRSRAAVEDTLTPLRPVTALSPRVRVMQTR